VKGILTPSTSTTLRCFDVTDDKNLALILLVPSERLILKALTFKALGLCRSLYLLKTEKRK
jgi:hypothetical protein